MTFVSPSILSADFANLEQELNAIKESGAEWVHVDVMDGIFVPNITIGMPVGKALRKVTDLVLDVHLMIDRPIRYVEEFVKSGADYVTIHVEADTEENTQAALDKIISMGCKAAISVKPGTPAEAAKPFLKKCSMILVMTVEPGFGNQSFMEDMMPKLKKLREMIEAENPGCRLEVDGGINAVTGHICQDNGADVLVSGSAFFKAEDKKAFVNSLRD